MNIILRFFLICIYLAICHLDIYSQIELSKIDSLSKLIPSLSIEEQVAANLYIARNSSFDLKEKYLETAEKIAPPGSVSAGDVQKAWAIYHVQRNEFNLCLDYLEKARNIYNNQDADKEMVYLLLMYVELYSRASNSLSATKYGMGALNLANELEDEELIGYSYLALSNAVPTTNPEDKYIHQAIKYLGQAKSRLLSHAFNNLGYRYYSNGILDSSLYYFKRSIDLKKKQKDPSLSNTYTNLGDLYFKMGEYKKTIEITNQNLILLGNQKNIEYLIETHTIRSKAFCHLEKLEKAKTALEEVNALLQKFPDPSFSLRIQYLNARKLLAKSSNSPDDYYDNDNALSILIDSAQIQKDSITIDQLRIQREVLQSEAELVQINQELIFKSRTNTGILFLSLLAILALVFGILYQITRKKYHQEYSSRLDQKQKIDQLEIEKLRNEKAIQLETQNRNQERLDHQKRKLVSSAFTISQKNELLKQLLLEIDDGIKIMDSSGKGLLKNLKKKIDHQISVDYDWKNLNSLFQEIHPDFFKGLNESYPNISATERRLCALIKMQMGNKDISRVLNVNPDSVLKSRYRLRKKFGLNKETNLTQFILDL